MSSEPVIEVRGLGKAYPMYAQPHHRLLELLCGRRGGRWHREHQALHEVSFEVRRGETIGIVGRNGSGKSTLLQILCGTLAASTGTVAVRGRVAALLELGAGFNPEFTGRENVFLNGTVLGLTREQVAERFDAIAAFAEIGEFMEQPVRTYSSGMYVRLAFAVAISVEPDVLIVDEALSVGDEAFQRKCFGRIEQLRAGGATILFVSHSAGTVVDLCDRALWLDGGELLAAGSARDVVAQYQRFAHAPEDRREALRVQARSRRASPEAERPEGSGSAPPAFAVAAVDSGPEDGFDPGLVAPVTAVYENLGARIIDPRVENLDGRRVNLLATGRRYRYRYAVEFDASAVGVRFGMMVRTITGVEIGGAASSLIEESIALVDRGARIEVTFEFDCRMLPGVYFLNAGVLAGGVTGEQYLDRRIDLLMVRVQPQPGLCATGLLDLGIAVSSHVVVASGGGT